MMEDTMETCNSEGDTWSDHFVATKNRRNESNLGVWAFEGLWIFKLRPTTKDPPWQSSCYLAGITGCFGFGMLETTWRHSLTLKIVSFNTCVILCNYITHPPSRLQLLFSPWKQICGRPAMQMDINGEPKSWRETRNLTWNPAHVIGLKKLEVDLWQTCEPNVQEHEI